METNFYQTNRLSFQVTFLYSDGLKLVMISLPRESHIGFLIQKSPLTELQDAVIHNFSFLGI